MPPPRSRRVRGPERSAFRTVSRTPRRAHLRPPCVAVLPRHELRPFPVEGWRRDSSRARHSISLYGGAKTMSRADHHPEPNGPNPSTEPSPGPQLDGIHLDPHEPSSTSAAPRPGHGAPENHMPCRTLAVRKRSSPMQFPDSDPLPRNPWPSPFLNHPPEQAIGLTRSVPHLAPKLQTLGESLIAPASWLPFSSAATWAPAAASRTCSPREHAGHDSASIRPLRSSHSGIPMRSAAFGKLASRFRSPLPRHGRQTGTGAFHGAGALSPELGAPTDRKLAWSSGLISRSGPSRCQKPDSSRSKPDCQCYACGSGVQATQRRNPIAVPCMETKMPLMLRTRRSGPPRQKLLACTRFFAKI
jgi:hypothetical protein